MEELESAFSEKTRAIVLNTPHNPVGKVSRPSGPMVRRTLTQDLEWCKFLTLARDIIVLCSVASYFIFTMNCWDNLTELCGITKL